MAVAMSTAARCIALCWKVQARLRRNLIPDGVYHAAITCVFPGVTRTMPPLVKIDVEYQILYRSSDNDQTMQGRRIYKSYILERHPADERLSQLWRKDLRDLLDATGTPYTTSFNSDHLLTKEVKIWVTHRYGRDEDVIFNNIRSVDTTKRCDEVNLEIVADDVPLIHGRIVSVRGR